MRACRRYTYKTTGALPELVRCDDTDDTGCLDSVVSAPGQLDVIVLDVPSGSLSSHPSVTTLSAAHALGVSKLDAVRGGHAIYPARVGVHTATVIIGAGNHGRLCKSHLHACL